MCRPSLALGFPFFLSFLFNPAFAGSSATQEDISNPGPNTVIATVQGSNLTISDLQQKRAGSLFQAENTYYQAERKALDELIDDYL